MPIQCKAVLIAYSSAEKTDLRLLISIDFLYFGCGAKKAELVPCWLLEPSVNKRVKFA